MRNQARENGENGKAERKNRNIGKATERQSQEEENGRNRKLSSEVLKQKRTKERGSQGSALKEKS